MPLPLFERANNHGARRAIIDSQGELDYSSLLKLAQSAASLLLDGRSDLEEARVAFLIPPGRDYVAAQWGAWLSGGVAVPLCTRHPRPELEYVIEDSQATLLMAHPSLLEVLGPIAEDRGLRLLSTTDFGDSSPGPLPDFAPSRRAMILYTSGTTSRPKGVVTTHANIQAQVESLVGAWQWTAEDHILHVLPLHHIHGIINVLTCALWSGACCELAPGFDAAAVWDRLAAGDLTLFMAVPTIYARLIAAWEAADPQRQQTLTDGCRRLRLMVSGSAALPVGTLEKWHAVGGHVLLERYGMTEIGMGLSNPLHGQRMPGCVGRPLPGVEVQLADEEGAVITQDDTPGEIQVRGPGVFLEYWNRPQATREAFRNGWFRTGDVAVRQDGVYRILGRNSVDIIKTGGYKVSALEIEEVLRTHANIAECAVVGVEDADWGQCVAVAVVPQSAEALELDALRQWCKSQLAFYKVPTRLLCLDELPRNQMGKVHKPTVVELFDQAES